MNSIKPPENKCRVTSLTSTHRTILIAVGIYFLCIGSLIAYEILPRYIVFSLPLPSDNKGTNEWLSPTHSTWRNNYSERYFIWHEEATLIHKSNPDDNFQQSIINYFDSKLLDYGWERSDFYDQCKTALLEANFPQIKENSLENIYVSYNEKNFRPLLYSMEGKFACLAIWNTSPNAFRIVLLTANPSPFTLFLDGIDF